MRQAKLRWLRKHNKFAVEGISEALNYEVREIGVRVKLVEPGIIETNLPTPWSSATIRRSANIRGLVGKLWEIAGSMMANGAKASLAAETIYTAATDGTDQLRYTAGEDARQLAAQRDSQGDATFFQEDARPHRSMS